MLNEIYYYFKIVKRCHFSLPYQPTGFNDITRVLRNMFEVSLDVEYDYDLNSQSDWNITKVTEVAKCISIFFSIYLIKGIEISKI